MLRIQSIKCDGLSSGLVTDTPPNITFSLDSDLPGESLKLATLSVDNWEITTTDQINNLFTGDMIPHKEYFVTVKATSDSGEIATATTRFQTGKLNEPWTGKWITDANYELPEKISPVPMTFKYDFSVHKVIKRAWIHATALGIYELTLNGEKVGHDYFAPGFTSYDHQIQYQTYDITKQIKSANQLLSTVAGGWAVGSFTYHRINKVNADRQAFLCELHIEYDDGTKDVLGSDTSWHVTQEGPFKMAEWYDGETYDATVDLTKVYWKPSDVATLRKSSKLLADYGSPVRAREILKPIEVLKSPEGEWIYNFGQNFAGVISAKIKGERGQKIIFRHSEVLVDQSLFVKSLRTAKATATYICNTGEQVYSPKLTYMGFQYVGVSGITPNDIELSAIVLHSDFEEIGFFECSNPLVNQLHSNIRWGGKSNFVDIPTDCPQRDERQGWTGDIATFASTACYNFDLSRFFDKWFLDMRSEQGAGGGIPMVIPRAGDKWPVMATSCWGDSVITVPWDEYLARGDINLLRKQYHAMKKFMKAAKWWSNLFSITPNSRHIWRFPFHFGDWCAPDELAKQWLAKGKWVATAYTANSCDLMSNIATLLGETDDSHYYKEMKKKISKAYRATFTDGKGNLKKEFQTAYVLPLHFNMVESEERKIMAKNLDRLVKEAGNHLTTGFTGTPYLLFALSDNGYADTAYDLLLQETCPSWLYEVLAGGTTIWERWDALRPDGSVNIEDLQNKKGKEESNGGMVSFNHYANGAVGDWLYKRMVGIVPTSGAYKTFKIEPIIGGGITYAKGSTLTPFGKVACHWQIIDGIFKISVTVPFSTTCTLILPSRKSVVLGSGHHNFECPVVTH